MSAAGLFAMGVLVTFLVGGGLSLLIYGAILDGRDEEARKAREAERDIAALERRSARNTYGRRPAA